MRRLFEVRGLPDRAMTVALLAVLLAATPIRAGLVFAPVNTLPGADAAALAGNGATLWAATPRGVWRLDAGAWTLDGLSAQRISSIAVADTVYAADGDKVWRRGADGTWSAETLPGGLVFPSHLATDGTAVWAAGLGVAKRSSGTWALLANPGGLVTAAAVVSGDLVVGLRGGAAQYAGATVTPISTGLPGTSTVQALGLANGIRYAGTDQTLYSFSGASWTVVSGFGAHDVRAVTGAGGTLRAATADAGVLSYAGTWTATNSGLLVASAKSFGTLGSDLYVGTAGAPVARLSGGSWSATGTGLYAASISDVKTVAGTTFAAAHGAGLAVASPPGANIAPDGCGNVGAITGNSLSLFAATNCHLYAWALGPGLSAPPSIVETGLPLGVAITSLAAVSDGTVAGGTSNAGMWRLVATTWSSDSAGLPANGAVQTTREVAGKLYASVGGSLFVRAQSAWQGLSGAPVGVQALGGDSSILFAAPVSGGIFSSTGPWREDDFGASTAFVSSLDVGGWMAFAGAGTAGVLRKSGGGWQPENAGLPPGADARVVQAWPSGVGPGGTLIVGTAGHGLFSAPAVPLLKTVPVVLDVVSGATGARFRTDLILGNRGAQDALVDLTFVAAPGFGATGGGSIPVEVSVPAAGELRISDAIDYLRGRGLQLPPTGPVAGSLSIKTATTGFATPANDALYAVARTYTRDSSGSYGLAYDAPSDLDAAEDEAAVYGLRSIAGVSRSNLAVVHVPDRSFDPITLSVQIYTANGQPSGAPLTKTLAPGEWYQWSGVLGIAGLPDGAFGYARITRASGSGPWIAYGVINDQLTNDGSFLPAYRPGGLAAGRKLVVPVVLDVFGAAGSHFTTELTVANDGNFSTPVDLVYQPAPNFGSSTGVPVVTFTLAAHQQTTIPDILAYLRSNGVNIPSPSAGTLSVAFRNLGNLDTPKTVALARTTTPNTDAATGGAFGVAYPAAVKGGGARASALVPGLARDASVRSNLAVVHLGGGSELPLSLSVRLYDATSSQAVGNPITVTLQPGDWTQWSSVFDVAGVPAGTTAAYAVITRLAGDDTWLAYGVLNDAKTSDGSILKMLPSAEY